MRRKSYLMILVLFTLACATVEAVTPAPVSTPMELTVMVPYPAQTARPTSTKTPMPTPVVFTPEVFPQWVAEFSDPLLRGLQTRYPNFSDDFPPVCIDEFKEWKVCSTPERRLNYQYPLSGLVTSIPRPTLDLQPDLKLGYSLLNSGWFFIVPESDKNPYYARVDSGMLVVKLPEGKEKKDIWVYNPNLLARNYVLQFDLEFGDSQPDDAFKYQFGDSSGEFFSLTLTKNKEWIFEWGRGSESQSHSGGYEYFSVAQVRVLIIARDTQCAVYLNNIPLDYVENCRADIKQRLTKTTTKFHLLGKPGYTSVMFLDNVQMWNLDKLR